MGLINRKMLIAVIGGATMSVRRSWMSCGGWLGVRTVAKYAHRCGSAQTDMSPATTAKLRISM
jgi:hypothetical protein